MNETLFYICGGILAASAVLVSLFGLKNDKFPGKWMPAIIVWFAVFAIGAGTFAVLHGKNESKDHDKEYAKASEEIEKSETSGPFEKAQAEAAEEEAAESGEEPAEEEAGAAEAKEATGGAAEPGKQVFIANGCGSCHTFEAAGTTGTTGPDLNEYLAPDDTAASIEESIVDPEAEIAEGYSGGIMPHSYGETIPKAELEQLLQFLVNNSAAGGEEEAGPGGEEEDVGGPTK